MLEVTVSGWMDGKIYFTGRPVYDQATQSIEIVDFDFCLTPQQRCRPWIRRITKRYAANLQGSFECPWHPQIDALKGEIQAAINSQVDSRVKLSGHVDDVRGLAILGTDDGYNAYLDLRERERRRSIAGAQLSLRVLIAALNSRPRRRLCALRDSRGPRISHNTRSATFSPTDLCRITSSYGKFGVASSGLCGEAQRGSVLTDRYHHSSGWSAGRP